jgi:DNA-binding CsgD family transcriptional regulator/GAF domain-containing protein
MVAPMSMAPSTDAASLDERVAEVVSAATDVLELTPADLPPVGAEPQLIDLARRINERNALAEPSDESVATGELLISILRLRCEQLDYDLSRKVRSLSEIRSALSSLRGLRPGDMITAAPVVLSRELAFARTMISTVRGSLWLPQYLHIAEREEVDPQTQPFRSYVTGAHIQLADAPLETDLVRKRCGALVPKPQDDKRTFKEIVEVSGCFGYIAAPITVQGRAIGMLHADRPEPTGVVTMEHLEQLEAFAECLAVAFESAVLEEKAAQQRLEVDSLCGNVDELLSRSGRSSLWSMAGAMTAQRHDPYPRSDQPASISLTAREREIMSHVATGATNGQIARCLVISEGTVKSHLKHIAKKLNTSSRAAAVAVYGGIAAGAESR